MSQHGVVHGGPKRENAPSWGSFPPGWDGLSMVSTGVPSTQSGVFAGSEYASYPAEFTEVRDPVQEAKAAKKKVERRDRRGKRKRNDAKTATETLLCLGIINTILWTIPIFGGAWHNRMFAGFGIGFTQMKVSLYTMDFDVECTQYDWPFGLDDTRFKAMSPEHQVCMLMKKMSGHHSLHAARDLACAITQVSPASRSCSLMETVLYGSYGLIFAFGISALLSFIATIFLYYYWYEEHLKQIRMWAMGLYIMAPTTGIMAFCIYSIVMPDLGELPRSWTSMVQTFNAGTGFGEIKPIGEDSFWIKYGWTWFFCYITFAFAMAAPVTWGVFFKKHEDEKMHEKAAQKEIEALEDAVVELEEKQDYVVEGMDGDAAMYAQQPGSAYCPPQYPSAYGSQAGDAYGAAGYGAYDARGCGASVASSQGGYGAYDARGCGASTASAPAGYGAYDARGCGASTASAPAGYGAYDASAASPQGGYGGYGGYGGQVAPS